MDDEGVLISGQFETSATFGEGEPNETTLETATTYDRDPFAARFAGDGTLMWAQPIDVEESIAARIDPTAAPLASFINRTVFATRAEAYDAIARYIDGFYNPTRRHSTLGYVSPLMYEQAALAA